MATVAPGSQKAGDRPISFSLINERTGRLTVVPMYVRPEDLAITLPSRSVVHQTLDDAWLDSFGKGVTTLQVSGHTGWRREASQSRQGEAADPPDGVERMKVLRETVFDRWHELRERAVNSGNDPADIRLIFSDGLDSLAWEVAPMSFTLKRSKSRPLLAQYQINMTALGERAPDAAKKPTTPDRKVALDSLSQSILAIADFAKGVKSYLTSTLGPMLKALSSFAKLTGDILSAVKKAISAVADIATPLLEIATVMSKIGTNIAATVAAIKGIPGKLKATLMKVKGAFFNAFCLMKNAFKKKAKLPDYGDLYGASTCSSTAGGRPVSPYTQANPFVDIHPNKPGPVRVSGAVTGDITALVKTDPVLRPMPVAELQAKTLSVTAGVALTGVA